MRKLPRKYRTCNRCGKRIRTTSKDKEFICRHCNKFQTAKKIRKTGVKNYPSTLEKRHMEIMKAIKDEARPIKQIQHITKIPLSSLYRLIKPLQERALVQQLDMIFQLSDHGKRIINNSKWCLETVHRMRKKPQDKRVLRFHALQGKYILQKSLPCRKGFLQKFLPMKVGRSSGENGFQFNIGSILINFYNENSISITFPDIYVPSIGEDQVAKGFCELGLMIDYVGKKLEEIFKLKIDSFCPFEITNMHIAIRHSKFAKNYWETHRKNMNQGNIITDRSDGYHELEAINASTAGQDIITCIRMEKEYELNARKQKFRWNNKW